MSVFKCYDRPMPLWGRVLLRGARTAAYAALGALLAYLATHIGDMKLPLPEVWISLLTAGLAMADKWWRERNCE